MAYCVTFEDFAFLNLGYHDYKELGPGEIDVIDHRWVKTLVAPGKEMKICTFLWIYYGYPSSTYEGVNVEEMRYRCGHALQDGIMSSRISLRVFQIPVRHMQLDMQMSLAFHFPDHLSNTRRHGHVRSCQRSRKWCERSTHPSGVSTVSIWLQVFELFAFLFRNGSDHTTCDRKMEGTDEVPNEVLQQYTDPNSEKYDQMIEEIRKELKFTSLQYNRLMICWNLLVFR